MDTTLKQKGFFFIFFFLLSNLSICQVIVIENLHNDGRGKENLEIIKEYAFCTCILEGYKKDSVETKDASTGYLFEMTPSVKLSEDLSDYIDTFIAKIKPAIHLDYHGEKAISLNCLKLYKSKLLEKYILQLMKKYKIPSKGNKPNPLYKE